MEANMVAKKILKKLNGLSYKHALKVLKEVIETLVESQDDKDFRRSVAIMLRLLANKVEGV